MSKRTTIGVFDETRKRMVIMKNQYEFDNVDGLINEMADQYEEDDE